MTQNLLLNQEDTITKENALSAASRNVEKSRTKLNNNATEYWNSCLNIIKDNVSEKVFSTWFEPIEALSYKSKKLTLKVPSQFFFEWIEEHYYELMRKTIQKVLGDDSQLQYEIIVEDNEDSKDSKTIKVPAFRYPPSVNQTSLQFNKAKFANSGFDTNLNPKYVFESFIIGDSNQLAYSAALAVANRPGGQFNPLFIYGDSGLGKTHLVQAIGNHILNKNPQTKILYTNSERFTQDFINAIQNNKIADFINYYRSIDVLIVDDIHFFAGKEKTQDNFFHTFNALYQSGKQVILTSDKAPKKIKDIDDRLISRFQSGLTVDIQPPDLEMRIAVLQKKSLNEGLDLPYEIIEYIARSITQNIRLLEGALISLIAKVTFDKKPMSVDLAKEVVGCITHIEEQPLNVDEIKILVSEYYELPIHLLESRSRKQEIALARQMCMFLLKKHTNLSLKSIGMHFGGRDHSTVLHACRSIEGFIFTEKAVKSAFDYFESKIAQRYER